MRARGTLPVLASVALGLGVALAARAPGYDLSFAYAFGAALLWRLALGRDGRRLLPRRVLAGVLATLLAVGATLLLSESGTGVAAPLPVLLETLTALATVALLARLDAFGAFWLVLLSSTLAAGACYVGRDLVGLLLVPLYVSWLAGTLVVLERTVAEERRGARDGGPQVLADAGSPPRRPLFAAVGRLVALGFVAGLLVWLVAPRPEFSAPDRRGPRSPAQGFTSGEPGRSAAPVTSPSPVAMTGPDETSEGVVLGTVGKIQEDNRVHFELRLTQGSPTPAILLREDTLDTWEDALGSAAARWRSSTVGQARRVGPAADGWVHLPAPRSREAARQFALTLRLDRHRLFLEPNVLRFRVRRPAALDEEGRGSGTLAPLTAPYVAKDNGQWVAGTRLLRGDVVEFRDIPQPRGGPEVLGATSGGESSPLPVYVEIDARLRQALLVASAGVEGVDARDPWRRAQALERWLQGKRFTYELSSPDLKAGSRVLDFLTRVRKGNCEWFATSLTLLLRAHGQAARYVRGYWGGSHTTGTDLWTFYGTHYHAWCELWLEGVGWVPLNPTPPERLADGADPRTREAGPGDRASAGTDEEAAAGAGTASGLRRWVAGVFEDVVARPVARSFGATGYYVGWMVVGLLVLLVAWRVRWRAARAAGAQSGGKGLVQGVYAQALRVLARRGLGRRKEQTAREFLQRVRGLLPEPGAGALERLTGQHERERYAGRPEAPGTGRGDLSALEHALKDAGRGGAQPAT